MAPTCRAGMSAVPPPVEVCRTQCWNIGSAMFSTTSVVGPMMTVGDERHRRTKPTSRLMAPTCQSTTSAMALLSEDERTQRGHG